MQKRGTKGRPTTTTEETTTEMTTTTKNDFCEKDENLIVVIHCTEDCVAEMKDCLIECDTDDKEGFSSFSMTHK